MEIEYFHRNWQQDSVAGRRDRIPPYTTELGDILLCTLIDHEMHQNTKPIGCFCTHKP